MSEPKSVIQTPFEARQSKIAMIMGLFPILMYDLDDETVNAIYEKVRKYDEDKKKLSADFVKDVFRI